MNIPLFQIDAFSATVFSGNPAAVCPLPRWLDEEKLQSIAEENNLSETAFFVHRENDYELRWFTPSIEVQLCGHATLASAFVIWEYLGNQSEVIRFQTRSGELQVRRDADLISMSFPVLAAVPCETPRKLVEGLGSSPQETWTTSPSGQPGNFMVVYGVEDQVRNLLPNFHLLQQLGSMGVVVTAPGDGADFVSRYFAPSFGVPEDPVTGSSHCTLVPYWADRLGKNRLHARQVSSRGGELFCRYASERVIIAGKAVCYLEGKIRL